MGKAFMIFWAVGSALLAKEMVAAVNKLADENADLKAKLAAQTQTQTEPAAEAK